MSPESQGHPGTFEYVAGVIEKVSGVSAADLKPRTNLLELGLDSLMFVRIGRIVEKTFGVTITMKHFYDELYQVEALCRHLDTAGMRRPEAGTPAEARPAALVPADAPLEAPAIATPVAGATPLDEVMLAHLALMRRYLAAGGGTGAPTRAVTAPQDRMADDEQTQRDAAEMRRRFSGVELGEFDLTARQQEFIKGLTERLSARCARSKQCAQDWRGHLADWKYLLQLKRPLKELRFPVVCERAAGAYVWDVDGNRYVDIAMGMGVHFFGHAPEFVERAIAEQMKRSSALGLQAVMTGEVAEKICRMTGHDRVAFFVSGSDAVMLALRLVRAARARRLVVQFGGSYHGICSDLMGAQGEHGTVAMSPGIPQSFVEDVLVLDYGSEEALEIIESRADELAAVFVEPVQSRRTSLQPQRFLRQLRRLTAARGVPLVFDEMVNGFRIAAGGAQEWFGVKADLSIYGKIVGGGLPMSVIGGSIALMRWVDGGVWNFGDDSFPLTDTITTGGTHNRHPLALAAANAVLDHIRSEGATLYSEVRRRMRSLADRVNVFFEREAAPLQFTHFGTQFRFEGNAGSIELELFFYLLIERGIFTWESHVCNLSTAHTDEDCDAIVAAIKDSVNALRAGGFAFRADSQRRLFHPMSSVQRRIYALTQREGAEKPYHLSGLWRLTGRVDADRLEDCFHQVICRHESLRTSFVVVDGEFYQHVIPEPRFSMERIEGAGEDPRVLLDRFIRPFDIEEPPLLRIGLAREADDRFLLLLDVHHLAVDGLSMNVVTAEVLRLYNGETLPPVRSQARHVQQAVDAYLAGDQARADKNFWMETLRGDLPRLDLPLDHPRPIRFDFQGERILLRVGTELAERLRRHASAAKSSSFGLLLAAFAAWLYRLTRQEDLLVGLPSAGRPGSDGDEAVGMFVNTMVLRAAVDPSATFQKLLGDVRDRLFALQEHGDFPFAAVLEGLGIRPAPDRNPLFDVMFSYEHAGQREIRTRDFTGRTLEQFEGAGMFDLCFDIIETEGELLVNCAFSRNLFDRSTVQRWLGDFEWMLGRILDGNEVGIAELAAARPEDAALIREWNERACQKPAPVTTLVKEWEAQVDRTPDAPALRDGDRVWTYAQLDSVTAGWGASLEADHGVKHGDRVLVSLDSSAELVMAALAILKTGAVYVPVTFDTPVERVNVVAKRAGSRLCITRREDLRGGLSCVFMDPDIRSRTRRKSRSVVTPVDSAYIIFTSGSTGEPKGVEISHAGICNTLNWRCRDYGFRSSDVTVQMPSCAFDASIIDIFSTLFAGGELVMMTTADKRTLPVLADVVKRSGVTNLLLTPSLYRLCLEQIPEALSVLRFITLAGEALPLDLAQAHFKQLPSVELWNEYGPTENSVVATCYRLHPDVRRTTIGVPIDHVGIHILDDHGQVCPLGIWGEIWLTGAGLAKGYIGLDVQTRERFRDLPGRTGCRAYRTGDIGRWLPDGEVDFLGRRDGQVKLNGYRIERQEVEAAMLKIPGIRGAVVDVVRGPDRAAYLAAWVVCPEGVPTSWAEQLSATLPIWMVPKAIVNLPAIPLSSSGKVNRFALPDPAGSAVQAGRAVGSHEPLNEAQQVLLETCRAVLKRPSLDIGDHYFESGGDSIQGILLVSRLHEQGWTLDLNEVFRHPVLRDLARVVTPGRTMGVLLEEAAEPVATPIQRWFFETVKGDANGYTQAVWLAGPQGIDLVSLQRLVDHWVAAHPAVSIGARCMDGQWKRVALDDVRRAARVEMAPDSADAETLALAAQRSLSLSEGPLLRVVLMRNNGASRVLVVMHHLVTDAVTWQILEREWSQLWTDIEQGREFSPLREPATFQQYATALQGKVAAGRALNEKAYWIERLGTKRPGTGAAGPGRGSAAATIPAGAAEPLLGSAHGVFGTRGDDLLLAAVSEAVARWSGAREVTLLLESNGRNQAYAAADFSATPGWMTSAYPLRIALGATLDWADTVVRVKEAVRRVPDQGVGFGVLRYVMKDSEVAGKGLPEVAYNYLGRFGGKDPGAAFGVLADAVPGDRAAELGLAPSVECCAFADADGLHITVTADEAHGGAQGAQRLAQLIQDGVAGVLAASEARGSGEKSPVDFADKGWTLEPYRHFLRSIGMEAKQVQDLWPLTPMQTGLLFQARLAPDDDAYFEQVHFRLGGVKVDLLEESFRRLVRRHAALRASFHSGEQGRSVQVIHRDPVLPVMRLDLSDQSPDEQALRLEELVRHDRALRFALARAPLMRVTLVDLGGGNCHVVWSHHHLLMDGWCVGILYENLMESYDALRVGRAVSGDAAPDLVPYFGWLSRRPAGGAEAFWRERLSGFDGPSRLPPWGLRRGGSRYEEGTKIFHLDRGQTERVRAWAAANEATLSSVLRLAWGVLLARFADREDVVFGSIVSGRPPEIPGMDQAVGLLINTVPVRFRLTETVTAVEGLRALRDQANEARAHEHLPLAEIQEACGSAELFDHLLVLENYPMEETLRGGHAGGSEGRPTLSHVVSYERTHYPLNIVASPGDGLEVKVMHDRRLYPDSQVEHLVDHLLLLLSRMVDNPDQPLARLDLLADAERKWLVKEWNATSAAYDKTATVVSLFDRQVARSPDAIALSSRGVNMTYAQLDAEAKRVAAGLLADKRFVRGGRIALWMPKSHEMIVAMLGVLKANAAYVPLDPLYPAERLRFILEDCGTPFVLAGSEMPPLDSPVPLLEMESLSGRGKATVKSASPDDCAYVIYTSGSTGQPKGCMVSHRNVVRLMMNERHDFDFSGKDVWVVAHSFCFDFSVWEMYGALLYGGRLVIPAQEQVRDTGAFYDLLVREGVTILNQTPPAFYRLADVACRRGVNALTGLRKVIFGGDRLTPELLRDWMEKVPLERVALINMYGITETTVHVTCHALTKDDIVSGAGHSRIGRPIPETEVWILDRFGNLQPPGVAGEMIVGGSGVCMGYLNRPELTAARFVPHPVRPGERVYRSGDLGRLDRPAGLDYLGRNDFQVQVRGFRVEVGEIENCLLKHEAVKKAVVLPFEEEGSVGLVAYIVGAPDEAPANWRSYLAKRLPEYMVPAHILWIDEIPLTGNGKIDRRALPLPGATAPADTRGPESSTEKALHAAWCQVLGTRRIRMEDSFFDVGGHSLRAVKLAGLLESDHGILLSVADVFEFPTIAEQARELARRAGGTSGAPDDVNSLIAEFDPDELARAMDALDK